MIEKTDLEPKVLVAIPTYSGKEYIVKEFMDRITNFTYPNYDIILVDSSMVNQAKKFRDYMDKYPKGNARKKEVIPLRRSRTGRQTLCKARNLLRREFLNGGYDYFFCLESDLIPPKNIIEKLLEEDKYVITALYEIGQKGKSFRVGTGKFWSFTMKGKFPLIHQVFIKPKDEISEEDKRLNAGIYSRQLTPNEYKLFIDGQVKMCAGCGMGCTLIHKDVLEKFSFRVNLEYAYHDDTLFYADLFNARIPIWIHTGYNIRHENEDWGEISKKQGYVY